MTNAVTTPGNPMEEFQERVVKKLRADIGEMLPDAALAGLVQRAVEDQFFKPRKVPDPNRRYGSERTIDAPSWFVEEVVKSAKPILEKQIQFAVAAQADKIDAAVKEFLASQNLMLLALSAIRVHTQQDIMQDAQRIVEVIKRGY